MVNCCPSAAPPTAHRHPPAAGHCSYDIQHCTSSTPPNIPGTGGKGRGSRVEAHTGPGPSHGTLLQRGPGSCCGLATALCTREHRRRLAWGAHGVLQRMHDDMRNRHNGHNTRENARQGHCMLSMATRGSLGPGACSRPQPAGAHPDGKHKYPKQCSHCLRCHRTYTQHQGQRPQMPEGPAPYATTNTTAARAAAAPLWG